MAQTSVAQLATDLKMPAGTLLEQLHKAGVGKETADDFLSEQDKSRLLEYLRRSHGEHDELLAAFARRDGAWAQAIMASHIHRAFHAYADAHHGLAAIDGTRAA